MSKELPPLETDEAARRFLESTDLTDHLDRATRAPLTRQFEAKDKALALRPVRSPPGRHLLTSGQQCDKDPLM